jgi:hypothetical protein
MRILAAILDKNSIQAILRQCGLPTGPPAIVPSLGRQSSELPEALGRGHRHPSDDATLQWLDDQVDVAVIVDEPSVAGEPLEPVSDSCWR